MYLSGRRWSSRGIRRYVSTPPPGPPAQPRRRWASPRTRAQAVPRRAPRPAYDPLHWNVGPPRLGSLTFKKLRMARSRLYRGQVLYSIYSFCILHFTQHSKLRKKSISNGQQHITSITEDSRTARIQWRCMKILANCS